jgi:hypothetical protein
MYQRSKNKQFLTPTLHRVRIGEEREGILSLVEDISSGAVFCLAKVKHFSTLDYSCIGTKLYGWGFNQQK